MENASNSYWKEQETAQALPLPLDLQDPTHLLPLSTTEVYTVYSGVPLAGDLYIYSCTITSKVTFITSCFSLSDDMHLSARSIQCLAHSRDSTLLTLRLRRAPTKPELIKCKQL